MVEGEEITTLTQIESIDKQEHLASRLILFIAIYVLLNYFILSEIYSFLGFTKNLFFTFLLVILSFSYVGGAAALRYSDNFLARTVNILGSIWLGTMVIASFTFIVVEFLVAINVLEHFQKPVLSFTIIVILVAYSIIAAMFTSKKVIEIKSSKIKSPVTLVQLSDLHIGAAHNQDFLDRIIRKVYDEKPDLTVITGDLIDGKHIYSDGYFDSLKKIKSPVYMVTGNHERMTGMRMVYDLLKNSGVVMLQDRQVTVNGLNLMGIDDFDKPSSMIKILKDFKLGSYYDVLLYHRPQKFKQARRLGVDLMLTGHTHAGQIFPLNLILRFFYSKVQGLKKMGSSYLYVSPGTGWWGPPMRLGSRNEITVFKLLPDDVVVVKK